MLMLRSEVKKGVCHVFLFETNTQTNDRHCFFFPNLRPIPPKIYHLTRQTTKGHESVFLKTNLCPSPQKTYHTTEATRRRRQWLGSSRRRQRACWGRCRPCPASCRHVDEHRSNVCLFFLMYLCIYVFMYLFIYLFIYHVCACARAYPLDFPPIDMRCGCAVCAHGPSFLPSIAHPSSAGPYTHHPPKNKAGPPPPPRLGGGPAGAVGGAGAAKAGAGAD